MNDQNAERKPKWLFDKEYSTQYYKEMCYLRDNGIIPTYVKQNKTYDVTTYKYKKTPELFKACAAFYEQKENSQAFDDMRKRIDAISMIVNGKPEGGASYGNTNS